MALRAFAGCGTVGVGVAVGGDDAVGDDDTVGIDGVARIDGVAHIVGDAIAAVAVAIAFAGAVDVAVIEVDVVVGAEVGGVAAAVRPVVAVDVIDAVGSAVHNDVEHMHHREPCHHVVVVTSPLLLREPQDPQLGELRAEVPTCFHLAFAAAPAGRVNSAS